MAAGEKSYDAVIPTPFGRLGIRLACGALEAIDFLDNRFPLRRPEDQCGREICREIDAYFSDPRHVFSFPLAVQGTSYQKKVWWALRAIPLGRVLSYGDLARRLGTGARAVGAACRSNPVPIVVPCHRVVSTSGIGGYMGQQAGRALRLKKWLLKHESA